MPSVAAPILEQAVLRQLKGLAQDPGLVDCLADDHWQTLSPLEQAGLLRGLVERVDVHGASGKLVIALHGNGLEQLAEELAENTHDTAQIG